MCIRDSFCTIEPNVGVVAVPDKRLDKLAEMYEPDKFTPATIEFVDLSLIHIWKRTTVAGNASYWRAISPAR